MSNGFKSLACLGIAALCGVVFAGCSQEKWDSFTWFGLKKTDNKPVTKSNGAETPAVAAADTKTPAKPASPEDAKSKDVDERVEKYVRTMSEKQHYDPSYQSGDFNDKIQRQKNPTRRSQVQKNDGQGDTESTDDDGHQTKQMDASSGVAVGDSKATKKPPNAATKENSTDDSSDAKAATKLKPPVLGVVKITASDSPPAEGDKPSTPIADTHSRPTANTPPTVQTVDSFKQKLTEQETLVAKDPNNVEQQFRLRLMYLVNGQQDKALAPTDGINQEVQEIMQAQLRSLVSAMSGAQRDPSAWANKQIESIESLRHLVRSRADLRVAKVVLCRDIRGFQQYVPLDPPQFHAGADNRVLVYIELDNYKTEQTSTGKFRTLVSLRQSLINKGGQEIWSTRDDNIEDLATEARPGFFLGAGPYLIPKAVPTGDYVYKVEVTDVLAQKVNSSSTNLKIIP